MSDSKKRKLETMSTALAGGQGKSDRNGEAVAVKVGHPPIFSC